MRRSVQALWLASLLAVAACSTSTTPTAAPPTTAPPSTTAVASPSAELSASPSASLASPSASTASPAACTATELTAAVTGWEGAMGSQIATVKLANASSAACVLQGTPQLQLVDADGHVLIDAETQGSSGLAHVTPGDRAWTIAPGDWVTTMVQVSNYCGTMTPVTPTTIAMILPSDGGRLVAAADSHGGAPACNGSPGDPGVIAMNGWAH